MNRTRRLVRLNLDVILLILLPLGGFLFSTTSNLQYVGLVALICLALVLCVEVINQLTLRETRTLTAKLKADREQFEAWKDKVKELDEIVSKISKENDEYRHRALEESPSATGEAPEAPGDVPGR